MGVVEGRKPDGFLERVVMIFAKTSNTSAMTAKVGMIQPSEDDERPRREELAVGTDG